MFHRVVGYWAETQCQLIFVSFDCSVTLALGFLLSFFNENVSLGCHFSYLFPTPPLFSSLPLIILQLPFLLYSSCIHEQSKKKKKERKRVVNDENPHWSPPKKTPLKKNLFSIWPWALSLSLSLSQWQGEHFFLAKSFANKNLFCLSTWLWLQTRSS
jgi:hypothetical protein